MPDETLPNQENPNLASQDHPLQVQNQPVVKNEKPSGKSTVLKFISIGVIAVLIIAGVAGGYVLGTRKSNNQTAETITTTSPSPTPNPTADLQKYEEDGFTFNVPDGYQIQKQTTDMIFWKSPYTPGEFVYSSMILYSQRTPFPNLSKDDEFTLYPQGSESYTPRIIAVQGIENFKKISLDGKSAVSYNVGCGADCYFHILQFDANGKYHRLVFNGAGGGLITKFESLLSSFKFTDSTSQSISPSPTKTTTSTGASLENIKYTLPNSWTGKIENNSLALKPSNGGYLSIKVYDYDGKTGRREFYCNLTNYCIDSSYFTPTKIGNISGYKADSLDNSGGGSEYFGDKGNKFYIISTFNPPSPNDYENNYQSVLNSLKF